MIDKTTSNAWDRDIRTQGLVGVVLLLLTLGTMTYHAWANGASAHRSLSDAAFMAFQDGKADLQSLFDGTNSERNLTLLKRRSIFGSDFAWAWMAFAYFLLRTMRPFRRISPHLLMVVSLSFIFTMFTNSFTNSKLAELGNQTVIADATLNSINVAAESKWVLLFVDALFCGLYLLDTPLILRTGGVLLTGASIVGIGFAGAPSGLLMPYCVLAIFIAFSGIVVLLLFHPQLAYVKSKTNS